MARFGLSPKKTAVDFAGTTRPDRFRVLLVMMLISIALECIEEGLSFGIPGMHELGFYWTGFEFFKLTAGLGN